MKDTLKGVFFRLPLRLSSLEKCYNNNESEVLKMNEPGLKKAMDTLQYLSQDSEARRLYEARQKYLHDEASMLGSAEMAGIKKVAKNMLDLNLDISIIIKATGLTEQEINALRK
ncbi:Rpn family recombination-promoting nuclease/putative transposase [Paenibacillus piscarius]|uniref:Rpn family recombination-promoting nuclease/putative transposase n=1 Tax=Paenibacillus piscarius TaxID=1089681 RepID=UPI001EE88AFA